MPVEIFVKLVQLALEFGYVFASVRIKFQKLVVGFAESGKLVFVPVFWL
jgi:hypothetical protein